MSDNKNETKHTVHGNPEGIPKHMEKFHKFCSDAVSQITVVEAVSRGLMFVSFDDNSEMVVGLRQDLPGTSF